MAAPNPTQLQGRAIGLKGEHSFAQVALDDGLVSREVPERGPRPGLTSPVSTQSIMRSCCE